MTITLSPEQSLQLLTWFAQDRADEAERVLAVCDAQRVINADPNSDPAARGSQVRVDFRDAEALASLTQRILLLTGKKVETRG